MSHFQCKLTYTNMHGFTALPTYDQTMFVLTLKNLFKSKIQHLLHKFDDLKSNTYKYLYTLTDFVWIFKNS